MFLLFGIIMKFVVLHDNTQAFLQKQDAISAINALQYYKINVFFLYFKIEHHQNPEKWSNQTLWLQSWHAIPHEFFLHLPSVLQ